MAAKRPVGEREVVGPGVHHRRDALAGRFDVRRGEARDDADQSESLHCGMLRSDSAYLSPRAEVVMTRSGESPPSAATATTTPDYRTSQSARNGVDTAAAFLSAWPRLRVAFEEAHFIWVVRVLFLDANHKASLSR